MNDELNEDLARLGHVLIRGAFEHTYLPSMSNALSDIRSLAPLVQPATLTQYNEFGQRVDRLHASEGWRELKDFAVREGYTAIAYERKCEEHNRTYGEPGAALQMDHRLNKHFGQVMCPMGMTDGAARRP